MSEGQVTRKTSEKTALEHFIAGHYRIIARLSQYNTGAGLITRYALHSHHIRVTSPFCNPMPRTKIATLNLRIDPGVKEALREAADRDHRSIANMVEMLIRRHCEAAGITIAQQSDLFPGKDNG